ncbi:unnamed protein product [Symbiodinium sp. CCMP2592]|nr:unnamed protein product [Symbiodinium sp. CCMP2592]
MKFFHVLQLACLVFSSAPAMKTSAFSRSTPTDMEAEAIKKGMEKVLLENAEEEMKELKDMPDPEEESKEDDLEGMASLGRNLEFMMLKLAQLETIVELQQLQIKDMNEWKNGCMCGEHNATQPRPNTSELQLAAEAHARKAGDTLKNVFQKHQHQRKTGNFAKPAAERQPPQPAPQPPQTPPTAAKTALLQRSGQRSEEGEEEQSLDDAVSSKAFRIFTSGTGMIGDALGEAYEKAKDPVAFVQNTVIDTVEMAVDILSKGFTDFKAGCGNPWVHPSVKVDEDGIGVNFGRQRCWFRLMGQQVTLFNLNFGTKKGDWPAPIRTAIRLVKSMASCRGGTGDIIKCLGNQMADNIPPLKVAVSLGSGIASCRGGTGDIIKCLGNQMADNIPPLKVAVSLGGGIASCRGGTGDIIKCLGNQMADNIPPLGIAVSLGSGIASCRGGTGNIMSCLGNQMADKIPPLGIAMKLGSGTSSCRGGTGNIMSCLGNQMADNIPPLKAVLTMGDFLRKCSKTSGSDDVIQCLGFRIISLVPPLSYLNQMSDMLTEFLEGFARTAATVASQSLQDGYSLIQDASVSVFPEEGAAPVVKHETRNFMIQTHSQRSKLATQMEGDGDDKPNDGLGFHLGFEGSHHASKLITQFGGEETDTESCLAFAPSSPQSRKKKTDWQAQKSDDFIKLEPWAVPCGNGWMKANPSKWEGYSFYTANLAIEKCLTVTYKMNAQPVLAFVGGLQFDMMPGPIAAVDAQVCWPTGQRGELSMLKTTIRSCGVTLFSRTLRLVKRFGSDTEFSSENTFGSTATWSRVENPRYAMSRTQLLETNSSKQGDPKTMNESKAVLEWETSTEDLYMASLDLGPEVRLKAHSELRGEAAARRLKGKGTVSPAEGDDDLVGLSASGSSSVFQLFSFKHPGMINFELQGLLDGNSLELGMQMGFGSFESEKKRLKLVDIADQFAVTLSAVPFLSSESKSKALEALRGFSTNYFPPPVLKPGTMVALYSKKHRRFLKVNTGDKDLVATSTTSVDGLRTDWINEYFTVVDAGQGQIALHSPRFNRFVRLKSDTNVDMSSDRASLPSSWQSVRFVPVNAGNGEVALYSKSRKRFVQMRDNAKVEAKNQAMKAESLPASWSWVRFQVVQGHPYFYLEPGSVITIYSWKHKRFLQMDSDGKMKKSGIHGPYVPGQSSWESTYFTVVEAGGGLVALHNTKYKRFVKMRSDKKIRGGGTMSALELPDGSNEERFAVVPTSNKQIALHSPLRGRFVSMWSSKTWISASYKRKAKDLPWTSWSKQKFKVYVVSRPSSPSSHSGAFEGPHDAQ